MLDVPSVYCTGYVWGQIGFLPQLQDADQRILRDTPIFALCVTALIILCSRSTLHDKYPSDKVVMPIDALTYAAQNPM